jgi:hypothetical protein
MPTSEQLRILREANESSIEIVNYGNYKLGQCPEGEYIGRWHPVIRKASPLANPFKIGPYHSRAEVIRMYKRLLWTEMRKNGRMMTELIRLARIYLATGRLTLICFCVPLPCHGEVVREAILYIIQTANPRLTQ